MSCLTLFCCSGWRVFALPISANQTVTFDGRLTFTIQRWLSRNLSDLMLGHNPLFVMMKEKGNVISGGLGHQFVEPLMVPAAGGPSVAGISDPYAELSHVEQVGLTSAWFTPAMYGMPISAPDYELKLQGSETKKVDYMEGVMKRSLTQFFQKLDTDFWAAESAAGSNGSQRNALGSIRTYLNRGTGNAVSGDSTLAEQDGTVVNSGLTEVGGIDRQTNGNAFWSTPVINTAETFSIDILNKMISLATRNASVPDLIITSKEIFNILVGDLQGITQTNIFDVPAVMKKFSAVRYRGCYITFDDRVPAGTTGGNFQMFVINSEHLKLRCETMEPSVDKRDDPKRFLQVWLADWTGQLTSDHLGRVHSRHADLSHD